MGDSRCRPDSRDHRQLNLLSIFHNLVAALWAVVALFPVAYLGTGLEIIEGRFRGVPELTDTFGWSVILWSTASVVLSVTMAVMTFIAGWRLAQRRARSFCLWVAAINCFFIPFGTVLGVLTLVVLSRPEVQEAFASRSPLPSVAAWEDTPLP
jgi:uncharacterized membrane protein